MLVRKGGTRLSLVMRTKLGRKDGKGQNRGYFQISTAAYRCFSALAFHLKSNLCS